MNWNNDLEGKDVFERSELEGQAPMKRIPRPRDVGKGREPNDLRMTELVISALISIQASRLDPFKSRACSSLFQQRRGIHSLQILSSGSH